MRFVNQVELTSNSSIPCISTFWVFQDGYKTLDTSMETWERLIVFVVFFVFWCGCVSRGYVFFLGLLKHVETWPGHSFPPGLSISISTKPWGISATQIQKRWTTWMATCMRLDAGFCACGRNELWAGFECKAVKIATWVLRQQIENVWRGLETVMLTSDWWPPRLIFSRETIL